MSMFSLGTLYATLSVNSAPLKLAEKEVNSFATRTSMVMNRLARTMLVVLSARAVGKFAKGFLDASVAVQNYKVSLNAVMKDAQKTEAVFEDLYRWAAINPIDTDDAIKSFVRLKTAGIANTRAAVAAAADAAVVMQKPVEYVANAMVSTNNKMLRQIGVQLDRTGKTAIIRSGNVRIEVEKDIDSIRQGIIKVLQMNFGGAMEEFKDTWRGALNTMKGLWWTFMVDVMGTDSSEGPFSLLVEGIVKVKNAWIEWKETMDYADFVENTKQVFMSLIEGTISGITMLAKAFKWLIDHAHQAKIAIMLFAGAKGLSFAISVFYKFRSELELGSAAVSMFGRGIYKLRLAFLALQTGVGIMGKLKGAIVALGLSPGGALFIALVGLYALAESVSGMFDNSSDSLRKFKKEIEEMPLEKLKAIVKEANKSPAAMSMGGFGLGGVSNMYAGVEAANRDIVSKIEVMKERARKIFGKPSVDDDEADKVAMGGGESKYIGLIQRMRDEAKYLGANVQGFLPILDAWASKMQPLSEDWKLIKDYSNEIREGFSKDAGKEVTGYLERLEKQKKLQEEITADAKEGVEQFWRSVEQGHSQGFIKSEEYFSMLNNEFEKLKQKLSSDSGGFLDLGDMFNWTEEMRLRFAEIQGLAENLSQTKLDALTQQLDRGVISQQSWVIEAQKLKDVYTQYPMVVTMIDNAITDMRDSALNMENVLRNTGKYLQDDLLSSLLRLPEELSAAFAGAIVYGNDLGQTLRRLAQDIAYAYLKALLFKTIFAPLGKAASADGNVFSGGDLVPFARGGIVNKPTLFPMASGMGLMGEAGPEAVMPLKRGADGKLGVTAEGEGSGATNITMNINAVDAQSFVQMLKTNRATVQSLIVDSLYKNGQVRKAIQGAM